MKKILIVSRSFYPEQSPRSFRTTELVKGFARQGHDVTLLTLKKEKVHSQFQKQFNIDIKDLGKLSLPKVNFNGSSGLIRLFKRGVRRGLLQLFEYPDIELMYRVKKALKDESGYDLLISIAVPHPVHWGVAWARSKENPIATTWAADCGDPFMGADLDTFNKWFHFKYFEKYFCRKADFVTVPMEDAKKGYYPEFRNKIEVIPQGFNFEEVKINPSSYSKNHKPTFAYAGSFIPGRRDPRPFLDYLVSLRRNFKFILYTKNLALIEPWLQKSNGRIEARDYIPRKQLLQTLCKMDFLINFENNSTLMMPSKLIDYYLAARPVLSLPSNEIDANLIQRFLDGDYESSLTFNGVDQYRIENVCRCFLELLKKNKMQYGTG